MDNDNITVNFDKPSPTSSYEEINNSSNNSNSLFSIEALNDKSISILGFELHFDDIIIIAIILFLLQEEKKDYLLIGVLGLMFFDFSIDKISSLEPLKKLLNNIT